MYSWELGPSQAGLGIAPSSGIITGFEWGGNEASNVQRVLTFNGAGGSPVPFAFTDATYIWRCFPKGPKTAGNPTYWTTLFWANYGSFNSADNFVGAHPYPFKQPIDGGWGGQNMELSLFGNDFPQAGMDGTTHEALGAWTPDNNSANGSSEATWNRWYTQVLRVFRVDANTVRHQFFWDWDLFVSSNGSSGWFQKTVSSASWGTVGNNPPTPSIVIGEAPPNDANTASWGDYVGREQFKGIVRGFQLYDARLGANVQIPTVADLSEIASELAVPGSVRTPWWKKINPASVDDLTDNGKTPWYPSGNKPTLWTGP
jgi:hypothetical protein